ncbi:MAG TPA: hypothetical protein VKT82_14320 [Ktedonobacterales bacterium]|nr:hypothetical protein [Ktedonobacterales bacterium]
MPKKSPARHPSTQQRPQPKRKDVMLVRSTSATEVVEDGEEEEIVEEKTETAKAAAPKTKTTNAPVKTAERPTATTAKRTGTPVKPGTQPTRTLANSKRGGRPGQRNAPRGPRIQVGRQANLVSAEHYRYVLKDLRLIGILAFCAFAVLIALTFILPHLLTY